MSQNINMFDVLPVELVEKILLYLTIVDLYKFFLAFDRKYSVLSDYFWREICLNENFILAHDHQKWSDCFEKGMKKRLGHYVYCRGPPEGKLEHAYSASLIVKNCATDIHNIYNMNCEENFELIQSITASAVYFKDEFFLAQNDKEVIIYKYNWESNRYEFNQSVEEAISDVFGISNRYCSVFHTKEKIFKIYSLCDRGEEPIILPLPEDVKFVIERKLHLDTIITSAVTFNDGYQIKIYDIPKSKWILHLRCFTSTGITNDPNVWVGTNFIACCDVSYRLRGIYFGPFKVWNKHGEKLLEAEIEPSNRHYLRCFFKNDHVLLTTSDTCINTYDCFGRLKSSIHTRTAFEDIKVSNGYMMFILVRENPSVDVYNWKISYKLYSVNLSYECINSISSEYLFCPYINDKYEVIGFI
jgi:hypothetical protein